MLTFNVSSAFAPQFQQHWHLLKQFRPPPLPQHQRQLSIMWIREKKLDKKVSTYYTSGDVDVDDDVFAIWDYCSPSSPWTSNGPGAMNCINEITNRTVVAAFNIAARLSKEEASEEYPYNDGLLCCLYLWWGYRMSSFQMSSWTAPSRRPSVSNIWIFCYLSSLTHNVITNYDGWC